MIDVENPQDAAHPAWMELAHVVVAGFQLAGVLFLLYASGWVVTPLLAPVLEVFGRDLATPVLRQRLALAAVVFGGLLLAALFVAVDGVAVRFLRVPLGRAARRRWARRLVARSADAWEEHLEEGERPLGYVEVDAPEARGPGLLDSLHLAACLGVAAVAVVGLAALTSAGSTWIETYARLGYWVFPVAVGARLLLGPATLPTVLGVVLAPVGLAALLGAISPDIAGGASGHPLSLALVAGVVLLALRAAHGWRRHEGWLVTSRGVRELEATGTRVSTLSPARVPAELEQRPGPGGSRWALHLADGEVLGPVRPLDDDPATFLEACAVAGDPPDVTGAGGRRGPLAALTAAGPRLAVPALVLAAAMVPAYSLSHLGLILGHEVIVHIALLTEGPADAARGALPDLRRAHEAYPTDMASLAFLVIGLVDVGELEELREVYPRIEAEAARPRSLTQGIGGQVERLLRNVRPAVRCVLAADALSARGWEPRDPEALRLFRRGLAEVTRLPSGVFRPGWDQGPRDLARAMELDPGAPGPRVVAVWYALTSLEAMNEVEGAFFPELEAEGEADDLGSLDPLERYARSQERVARLRELLLPLEDDPAWAGLAPRLRGAAHPGMDRDPRREVIDDLLRYGDIEPWRDRLATLGAVRRPPRPVQPEPLVDPTPDLCDDPTALPGPARLVFDPPDSLDAFLEAWPERARESAGPGLPDTQVLAKMVGAGPDAWRELLREHPAAFRHPDGEPDPVRRFLGRQRGVLPEEEPEHEEGGEG